MTCFQLLVGCEPDRQCGDLDIEKQPPYIRVLCRQDVCGKPDPDTGTDQLPIDNLVVGTHCKLAS